MTATMQDEQTGLFDLDDIGVIGVSATFRHSAITYRCGDTWKSSRFSVVARSNRPGQPNRGQWLADLSALTVQKAVEVSRLWPKVLIAVDQPATTGESVEMLGAVLSRFADAGLETVTVPEAIVNRSVGPSVKNRNHLRKAATQKLGADWYPTQVDAGLVLFAVLARLGKPQPLPVRDAGSIPVESFPTNWRHCVA